MLVHFKNWFSGTPQLANCFAIDVFKAITPHFLFFVVGGILFEIDYIKNQCSLFLFTFGLYKDTVLSECGST